jgi:hypothetical protein
VKTLTSWLANPIARCLESGEKEISLGKSLVLRRMICKTVRLEASIILNSPF